MYPDTHSAAHRVSRRITVIAAKVKYALISLYLAMCPAFAVGV